jgi:hypothetical protein
MMKNVFNRPGTTWEALQESQVVLADFILRHLFPHKANNNDPIIIHISRAWCPMGWTLE